VNCHCYMQMQRKATGTGSGRPIRYDTIGEFNVDRNAEYTSTVYSLYIARDKQNCQNTFLNSNAIVIYNKVD